MENVDEMAYAEIYEMLEIFGDDYKKKMPENFYNLILEKMPKKYNSEEVRKKVANNEVSQKALNIFAIIYTKYFVQDEIAKEAYDEIFIANGENNKSKIDEKEPLNIKENIFEDRKNQKIEKEKIEAESINKTEIVQYEKTNIFRRIINKMKKMFNK